MKQTTAVGHHGTSLAAAESIRRAGFKLSRNKHDWLGDGAYFFQDAPFRAYEWARGRFGGAIAVIECRIQIRDFIDLLDIEWASWLSETHDRLVAEWRRTGVLAPVQHGRTHRLDREVLNYGIKILEADQFIVRGVRGAFVDGTPVFPNSALFTRTHVQIAIRDLSMLSETRILGEQEILNAAQAHA